MFDPLISIGPYTFYVEFFVVMFLGLTLGSFASALIYRVPRQIPWGLFPARDLNNAQPDVYRSACPQCMHPLGILDLVPVLSWLCLRGKCRHCHAPIGATYILAELFCLGGVLGVYLTMDLNVYSLVYMALIPFLVALLFIDLAYMILPNILVGIGLLLGGGRLGLLLWGEPDMAGFYVVHYAVAAVLYGFIAWVLGAIITRILKKDSLGFGDVKFFIMVGVWLGIGWLSHFMILSGLLGVGIAVLWRFAKGEDVFPFGPALILSFYILILVGGSHF